MSRLPLAILSSPIQTHRATRLISDPTTLYAHRSDKNNNSFYSSLMSAYMHIDSNNLNDKLNCCAGDFDFFENKVSKKKKKKKFAKNLFTINSIPSLDVYRGTNTASARGCISGDFVHSARDWQLRGRSINGFYVNPELNLMFRTVEMNVTLHSPSLIFPYRYFFLLLLLNPPPPFSHFERFRQLPAKNMRRRRRRSSSRKEKREGETRRAKTRRKAGSVSRTTHALMPNKPELMIGIRLLPHHHQRFLSPRRHSPTP